MGKCVRCISTDGTIAVMAVDSTNMIERMREIHDTSVTMTAALGRLVTASSLMGVMLKGKEDSVTLRVQGNGPAGMLIAVSDSAGNARGMATHPKVDMPEKHRGKLDVGGAVGRDGFLYVLKDMGLKDPYVGQVPLVSGEIAEDITSYYAMSEQTPTVCALGVLVAPDHSVQTAGGFLIQLLPTAEEDAAGVIEQAVKEAPPITSMLREGLSPEEICRRVMGGIPVEVLDERNVEYVCNCSRERVERALLSTGREALDEMIADGKEVEVCCHFCEKKYTFSPLEVTKLRDHA